MVEHVFGRAVVEVVFVLHRDDLRDLAGALELGDVEVGDADVPDLARALRVHQRPERILERHLRIDRVQLVEVDALELQALQAAVDRLLQVLGPAVLGPRRPARGRTRPPLVAMTRSFG